MALEITERRLRGDLAEEGDPFALREDAELLGPDVHLIRRGVICDTERRGRAMPGDATLLEIVLDASEGFIPLWAKGVTLRWRFHEPSLTRYKDPAATRAAVETLFGEALLLWGDAAPVRFARDDDTYDFQIVLSPDSRCDTRGCVLARAFFPDAGRHDLILFPEMFGQPRQEQIETLAHEIGHIFGLRHFFALLSEQGAPAVVFGQHSHFSIMNYGDDSRMTEADQSDLKDVYSQAWSGNLTSINGTPIRLVNPYHASGVLLEAIR